MRRRSIPTTAPPEIPALRGTEVHVLAEGQLLHKPTFLRPWRPVTLRLRGTHLRLTDPTNLQLRSYALDGAKLAAHAASRKLTLDLPDGSGPLRLQAQADDEYAQWCSAFEDALSWGFDHFYTRHEALGEGAFATVHRAVYRANGENAAVKVIPTAKLSGDDLRYLQTELDVALCARHPNIVAARDLFQAPDTVYIVQEYLAGGTLHDFVKRQKRLDEKAARAIFEDILHGLCYIHALGFVHRDLKPENIMCSSKTGPGPIKIVDFGLSRRRPVSSTRRSGSDTEGSESDSRDSIGPGGLMMTPVGTPNFVAPEVLSSLPYGQEVDLFAAGVILFWMLSGTLPFVDVDTERLAERIRRTDYSFDNPLWDTVSDQAKDLVTQLLQRSPCERLSAGGALAHPWMRCRQEYRRAGSGPGDEIIVRKWKADPEFEGSQTSSDGKGE